MTEPIRAYSDFNKSFKLYIDILNTGLEDSISLGW